MQYEQKEKAQEKAAAETGPLHRMSLAYHRDALRLARRDVPLRPKAGGPMSSPRYDWWGYVKGMTRRYPQLMQQYRDLRETRITARWDGLPGGSGMRRPVEDAVQRTLPRIQMKELAAVQKALQVTRSQPRGQERVELIRLVYWKRSHTLAGAALQLELAEITAKRWHGEFLREVGRAFGLLEE